MPRQVQRVVDIVCLQLLISFRVQVYAHRVPVSADLSVPRSSEFYDYLTLLGCFDQLVRHDIRVVQGQIIR